MTRTTIFSGVLGCTTYKLYMEREREPNYTMHNQCEHAGRVFLGSSVFIPPQ